MRHINESILSKKSGLYKKVQFPAKPNRDDIEKYLKKSGYIDTGFTFDSTKLVKWSVEEGAKLYTVGAYNPRVLSTQWIRWTEGTNHLVYMVRTIEDDDKQMFFDNFPGNWLYMIELTSSNHLKATKLQGTNDYDEFRKWVEEYGGV